MQDASKALLDKLSASKKYGDICPDAISRVILQFEGRYKKPKDFEKAVREDLHGITSAFNDAPKDLSLSLAELKAGGDALLESLLSRHASTRERLPLAAMDALYARIFEATGQPESLLDLACGLNPLYLAMRFPRISPLVGMDISRSCTRLMGLDEQLKTFCGIWGDLLSGNSIPDRRFQVALLFKILPLLERQQAGAAMDVMSRIRADYLVISFPTRTLGGRNVGMESHYAQWMDAHLPESRTIVDRFIAGSELFYILKEN